MRKIFTIAILALSINAFAQIPTNGLIGWYPFNGNANDESAFGNNGTVTNAALTTDRFGNAQSAYYFDGNSKIISTISNLPIDANPRTISAWFQWDSTQAVWDHRIVNYGSCPAYTNNHTFGLSIWDNLNPGNPANAKIFLFSCGSSDVISDITPNKNWHNAVATYDGAMQKLYFDGVLIDTMSFTLLTNNSTPFVIGASSSLDNNGNFKGKIDDIGVWNRALTPVEINQIYNTGVCYQTITVTDTLIINANVTGFNPVTYQNSIKIYPNPTSDQITIDFGGNYSTMNGYTLKITNSLSQVVYTTPINTQTTTVDLSTWTGNGIYFVHLIDASSNTIDIRKIVLQ